MCQIEDVRVEGKVEKQQGEQTAKAERDHVVGEKVRQPRSGTNTKKLILPSYNCCKITGRFLSFSLGTKWVFIYKSSTSRWKWASP